MRWVADGVRSMAQRPGAHREASTFFPGSSGGKQLCRCFVERLNLPSRVDTTTGVRRHTMVMYVCHVMGFVCAKQVLQGRVSGCESCGDKAGPMTAGEMVFEW